MSSTRTRDTYEIAIREGLAEVLPGFQTPIYGYNGIYPGPAIRARKGREVVVRQRNRLPFDTNVHLHGGYVPAAHDGHPMDVIPAGGAFDYHYPNDQDAATSGTTTTRTAARRRRSTTGSSRCTCSRTSCEAELGLPQGEFDVPIVIADHAFNKDGSFRYEENVDLGFRGDTMLVNGAVSPRMAVQRRSYRLRFLNGVQRALLLAAARQGPADAPDRRRWRLALETCSARGYPLHPAERIDLVLDFSAYGPGEELVLSNEDGLGGTVPIMRFDVEGGGPSEDFQVPSRMRQPEPLPAANARRRWDLALGSAAWQINGLGFDPNRIDVRPRRGSTEIWTFVNHSNRVHPMHLHGFQFRVLERSSAPVEAADRLGWKDTVGVLPNETVSVLAWFAPYGGKYVFHCHSLEHADKAMMLQMEVV